MAIYRGSGGANEATDAATNQAAAAAEYARQASESALDTQALYDTFNDAYLGSKSTAPTLDNDGNALAIGALYFDSAENKLKVYSDIGWIDSAVASPSSFTSQAFSGTGVQTVFTLSTAPSSIQSLFVFVSGLRLRPTLDYTVASTTLTFAVAPANATNNISVLMVTALAVGTPDDNSISTAKIQNGVVTLDKLATGVLVASNVTNTPTGSIVATDVQTALNELDTEKLSVSGDSLTGELNYKHSIITATATTTPLFAAGTGNIQDWTGTPTITAFPNAPQAGAQRIVYPSAGTIITSNSEIAVQGDKTYTTQIGDELTISAITTTTFYVTIAKRSGYAIDDRMKLQSIGASASAGALTLTQNPISLDFRSATLTSGMGITSAVQLASMVVPSGVNLGSVTTQNTRLIQLVLSSGEVAVSNINGLNTLDETGVITTEPIAQTCTFTGAIAVTTGILTLTTPLSGTFAIGQELSGTNVTQGTYVMKLLTGTLGAAASTYQTNQITAAASTTITGKAGMGVYSDTARTGFAYRVAGFVDVVNTAGVWATPTLVQPAGGIALTNLGGYGVGQKYKDATITSGTTYYNTSNKPKSFNLSGINTSNTNATVSLSLNAQKAVTVLSIGGGTAGQVGGNANVVIPAFASYKFTHNANVASMSYDELS